MADRDVIAEPVIRLRAESTTLKADLDKAKAEVKNATNEIARDAAKALVEGLEKKLAGVGSALSKAEKRAAKESKAIQGHIDRLNATKATASMALLEKAVEKVGGTSKLSGDQIKVLTAQVERLAAAGAKVPKTLALPKLPTGGVGAGVQAGLQNAAAGFAPGGAIGAGLAAIGPAGLAAAAGIGAFTIATKGALEQLTKLAGEAERWTNVAGSTGLGVKQVQQLESLLVDAGFEAGDLGKIMKGLATEVANGGESLAKFGIDVRELKGLAPEELLREIARQATAIADPIERATALNEIFGKNGAKAYAALKEIGAGAYQELGALEDQQIQKLLELDARLDAAGRAWINWKNEALVALVDTGSAVEAFLKRDMLKNLKDFLQGGAAGLAVGVALDATAAAPGNAGQSGGVDPSIAALEAEQSRKKKAEALAKEKKDAAEADSRAAKALAERQRRENEYAATRRHNEAETLKQIKEREEAEKSAKAVTDALALSYAKAQVVNEKGAKSAMEAAQATAASVDPARNFLAAIDTLGPTAALADEAMKKLSEQVALLGGVGNLTAEQLATVQSIIEKLQGQGATKLPENLKAAVGHTKDLVSNLAQVASIFADLGQNGLAGMISGLARSIGLAKQLGDELKKNGKLSTGSKLAIAQEAVGIGVDAFHSADTNTGRSVAKGALGGAGRGAAIGTGILPGYGTAVGAVVGGIIGGVSGFFGSKSAQKKLWNGLTQSLTEQFGSLDKAREAARKYGIELDKALNSKNAGVLQKAINDLGNALKKAQQDAANRAQLEAGVGTAAGGAQELQGILDQLGPKAQAAGGALVRAVQDAITANGLGFLATGDLADGNTAAGKQFGAVQQAVGAAGTITQGLRQAGGIDANFLANGGAFADALREEAVAAALAAGKTQEEANKIGIATIAPLLRDQLNASLESGKALSGKTQELLDTAKANGIEILADPTIALLDESKQQTALLRDIAGKGGPDGNGQAGESKGDYVRGRKLSAAAGYVGLTGMSSPRIDLQLHPNEELRVTPGVTSSSLNGVTGGGGSSGSMGGGPVTFAPSITINGATQSPSQIADAVVYALDRQSHKLNAVLEKRYGR